MSNTSRKRRGRADPPRIDTYLRMLEIAKPELEPLLAGAGHVWITEIRHDHFCHRLTGICDCRPEIYFTLNGESRARFRLICIDNPTAVSIEINIEGLH